jgi:hypothetical protein
MNDDQILTIEEAAQFLKMTPRQVFELCRVRSQERMEYPFPAFSIHSKAKRVRKSDLMAMDSKACCEGSDAKAPAVASPESSSTLHVAGRCARIGDGHRRAEPKLNGRAPFD